MLTLDLEREENPLIVADEVGIFVSDALRDERISLHSAFLLNQDVLRIRRLAYRQPAWQYQLSLSGVLALFMQYLFGLAIEESNVTETVAAWLHEDLPYLGDKRGHYIRKYLNHLTAAKPSEEQLIELSEIRSQYATLADEDGPFHTEVFPYDYFSPEDALLGRSVALLKRGTIEPDVEELMLRISAWG